jgi:hypothetical protein
MEDKGFLNFATPKSKPCPYNLDSPYNPLADWRVLGYNSHTNFPVSRETSKDGITRPWPLSVFVWGRGSGND